MVRVMPSRVLLLLAITLLPAKAVQSGAVQTSEQHTGLRKLLVQRDQGMDLEAAAVLTPAGNI